VLLKAPFANTSRFLLRAGVLDLSPDRPANETNFRCDAVTDGEIDEDDLFLLINEWR
jgi:hypothetical protein